MITIKAATYKDVEVLALLGRITYAESHGHYIHNKNDLQNYLNSAFSIEKIRTEENNPEHIFHLIYIDDFPVGYTKLVLNATHESVNSKNTCRLERIYILEDFIPLKIGQQILEFIIETAQNLEFESVWLSVYIKNNRAIRFYEKNHFKKVGGLDFLVNGKKYENFVLLKTI